MKAKLLVGSTPKVPPDELKRLVKEAGFAVGDKGADFGVVVGGDGRFSWYGRTERIPLLFVGVRAHGAEGSKAYLARTTYRELPRSLKRIGRGDYTVKNHPRLAVRLNGRRLGDVFTDVYLQRGSESACIRYRVKVKGAGEDVEESAIGDGVVVSTKAGSTGYYSYLERIQGAWMNPEGVATIDEGKMGVCHINPTFTERTGEAKHPLRYAVPLGSTVELSLFRKADARLYGTTPDRGGVRIEVGDRVTISLSKTATRLISF